MMSLIAGNVVNALGLGTAWIGLLSSSGVPARLNCVMPAPGNWSSAVPLSYNPMLVDISPFTDGSTPLFTEAKNQSFENPYIVAMASRSPLLKEKDWET